MKGHMTRTALAILPVLLVGCAVMKPAAIDQRSPTGPTAEQVYVSRTLLQAGREPTFEERLRWNDTLDRQISRYLAEHPEAANNYDVAAFRFEKQPAVGMTKEQVLVLLGTPDSMTTDPAEVEKLARGFWPQIKTGGVGEAWVYPLGWRFFFAGPQLSAITQYLPPNE
jgi:hypothetical protein